MGKQPASTVFYSRKTLIVWVAAASAFWIAAMGFLLLSSRERRSEERSRSRETIRNFTQETIRLRAEAEGLKGRSAELEAKYKEAAEKLKRLGSPAAAVMEESRLPFGEAAEAVPGRLFITVARVAGGRARIRIAELIGGKQANRETSLAPGESWQFTFGGETYALLLHAIEQSPPGARISIRKLPS